MLRINDRKANVNKIMYPIVCSSSRRYRFGHFLAGTPSVLLLLLPLPSSSFDLRPSSGGERLTQPSTLYRYEPNKLSTFDTMTTTNVTTDEDGLFETAMSSDYDYDHPYTETAREWHDRHVLKRARRLAGIETSCSCSSSSTSSDSSFTNEILGGAEEEDGTELGNHHDNDIDFAGDFGGGGGGVNNNDESRRRKAIKSGRRPLYRWMTTHPLVAARCCLSLDPSSSSTGTITARTTASAARSNSYNTTATTPREDEAMRLRRVLRRLHHRKQHNLLYPKKILKYSNKNGEEYDVVATSSSPAFHQPPPHSSSSLTSSSVTMSLEQQLLRIKQESIDTESNRMVIQSFLPRGTGISFIDAALLLKCETKEDQHHTTASRYSTTTSRLVLELVSL